MIVLKSTKEIAPLIIKEADKVDAFKTVTNKIYDLTKYIKFILTNKDVTVESLPNHSLHEEFNIIIYFDVVNEVFVLEPKINQTIKVIDFEFGFLNKSRMGTIGTYIYKVMNYVYSEEEFYKKVESLIKRNIKLSIKNLFSDNYRGSWSDVFSGVNIIDTMSLELNSMKEYNLSDDIIKNNGLINDYEDLMSDLFTIFESVDVASPLYTLIELAKSHHNIYNLSELVKVEPRIYDTIEEKLFVEFDKGNSRKIGPYCENKDFLDLFDDDRLFNFFIKPYAKDIDMMDFIISNYKELSSKLIGQDNIIDIDNGSLFLGNSLKNKINGSTKLYNILFKCERYYRNIGYCNYVANIDFVIDCINIYKKESLNNYFVNSYDVSSIESLIKSVESGNIKDISEFYTKDFDQNVLESFKKIDLELINESGFSKDFLGFPKLPDFRSGRIQFMCRIKKDKLI